MSSFSRQSLLGRLLVLIAILGAPQADAAGMRVLFLAKAASVQVGAGGSVNFAPAISPGSGFTGTNNSGMPGGVAPDPNADTTVYGASYFTGAATPQKVVANFAEPASMWYEPSSIRSVCVIGGISNRLGIDHIDFTLEGTTVTVSQKTWDTRVRTGGWCVTPQSAPGGAEGETTLYAHVVPKAGYARTIGLPMTLATNGPLSAARPVYHVGQTNCGDNNSHGNTAAAPWCTIAYAEQIIGVKAMSDGVVGGSKVYVAGGNWLPCNPGDHDPNFKAATGLSDVNWRYNARMVEFFAEPGTGTVNVARPYTPDRYLTSCTENGVTMSSEKNTEGWTWRLPIVRVDGFSFDTATMTGLGAIATDGSVGGVPNPFARQITVYSNDDFTDSEGGARGVDAVGAPRNNGGELFNVGSGSAFTRAAVVDSTFNTPGLFAPQFVRNSTAQFTYDAHQDGGMGAGNEVYLNYRVNQIDDSWTFASYIDDVKVQRTLYRGGYTIVFVGSPDTDMFLNGVSPANTSMFYGSGTYAQPEGTVTAYSSDPTTKSASGGTNNYVTLSVPSKARPGDFIRIGTGGNLQRRRVGVVIDSQHVIVDYAFSVDPTGQQYWVDPIWVSMNMSHTSANGSVTAASGTTLTFAAATTAQVGDEICFGPFSGSNNPTGDCRIIQTVSTDNLSATIDSPLAATTISAATPYYINYRTLTYSGDMTGTIAVNDTIRWLGIGHSDFGQWSSGATVTPENYVWDGYYATGTSAQQFLIQTGRSATANAIQSVGVNGNNQATVTFTGAVSLKSGQLLAINTSSSSTSCQVLSYNSSTFTAIVSRPFAAGTNAVGVKPMVLDTVKDLYMTNSIMGHAQAYASFGHFGGDDGGMINVSIVQSTLVGEQIAMYNDTGTAKAASESVALFDNIFSNNLPNGVANGNFGKASVIAYGLSHGLADANGFAADGNLAFQGNVMDGGMQINTGNSSTPYELGDSTAANGFRVNVTGGITPLNFGSDFRPVSGITRPITGNPLTGLPIEPWDLDGTLLTSSSLVGARH